MPFSKARAAPKTPATDAAHLAEIRRQVSALLDAIGREEHSRRRLIAAALPGQRLSAANLARYVGLRRHDLHRLQLELAGLGLSSLGRSEGHVRDTLQRLERWLTLAAWPAVGKRKLHSAADTLDRSRAATLLRENTRALFGPQPDGRHVYVMVTAPSAAEATQAWADGVLLAGADLIRINAAHETAAEWRHIAEQVRTSAAALGRQVRVFVDLPGPKLRADILRTQAAVRHYPRNKDHFGRTAGATEVQFVPPGRPVASELPGLPLPRAWFAAMHAGDRLRLVDTAGRKRELIVVDARTDSVRATCAYSLYLAAGVPVSWHRGRKCLARGRIGALPREPAGLLLETGSCFLLNNSGRSAGSRMPVLACPEPGLLRQIRRGERVVLDDGRVLARVESASAAGIVCRVTRTAKSRLHLKSGKGIAFPDSHISLPALGAHDAAALAFAIGHADGVDVSFVNTARDVERIIALLRGKARPGFGLVLKLETRGAIRNLPEILFAALRYSPTGLMIARGDLAVETSFEHLAELQEEILGFGEAAHLPVIWATQVLDTLAHSGVPTRAEVTDAAMSMRAECVMLNKGPFVAEAVRMLAEIIRGMEPRQFKKRPLFAPLAANDGPNDPPGPAAAGNARRKRGGGKRPAT